MSISKSSLSLFLIFVFVEKRKKKTLQQFSILIPHLLTIGILPIFMRRYTHTFVISDRFLQAFFRRRLFSLPFTQTSFAPSPSRKVGRHCHGGGLPRLAEACHLAALAEACRICRPALPPGAWLPRSSYACRPACMVGMLCFGQPAVSLALG